jgi:hypothetical protein
VKIARMRTFLWILFAGAVIVVVGILIQAFTIAAYVRGAGDGALDAHGGFSGLVHLGQLLVVIGAIGAFWRNWTAVGIAVAFLVTSVAQLAFLGDNEEQGGWINGLHGMLALVLILWGAWYASRAAQLLGLRSSPDAAGGA